MAMKKFKSGDVIIEDKGSFLKCRDIFSNDVLEIVPKKKGGRK